MKKSSDSVERPVRVGLISLGCAKNLVDAEIMLGSLLKGGVQIINDASQADVVIVNTCSFIDAAQEESVDTILQSAELREAKNRGQGLIVSGCLPQRFRDELPKLLPEVDAFMGIDQVAQVTEIVHKALERRKQRLAGESPKSKVQSPKAKVQGPKSKGQGPKSRIIGRFAELERSRRREEADDVVERPNRLLTSAATEILPSSIIHHPSSPLFEVHSRPNYIPDYATPRFR